MAYLTDASLNAKDDKTKFGNISEVDYRYYFAGTALRCVLAAAMVAVPDISDAKKKTEKRDPIHAKNFEAGRIKPKAILASEAENKGISR